MRKIFALLIKTLILCVGASALICLIWFPQTEGRAANLDLVSIYKDPLIIYIYFAAIPFFIAHYQALRFVSYFENKKLSSVDSLKSLRMIQYCALTIIGFFVGAEGFLFVAMRNVSDDMTG